MNAQHQLKVSVFGHQSVRRLSEYMALDSSRGNLGLAINGFTVEVLGYCGLKLKNNILHRLDSRLAKSVILFLDLGLNDLCDQTLEPQKFVRSLLYALV